MKTNIFITTIVLVLGAFFTFSQAQTDKTITRNESVSQFSSIRFEAVGDVNFEQSSEYSLRIEGPEICREGTCKGKEWRTYPYLQRAEQ